MADRNVLGGELEPCGTDPVTGFYRDGCCSSGPEDLGSHTVCAVVTREFLRHQQSVGNDLVSPVPAYGFPGLRGFPTRVGPSRRLPAVLYPVTVTVFAAAAVLALLAGFYAWRDRLID